jgi:ATP-dependent RNA helicase DHX33
MTGQEEIESTVKTICELNKANMKSLPIIVLPLYSSMPSNKQLKVFEKAPSGHRKIIISTNIAETSITIRGIKYVIDTGMIKSKMYTPGNNLEVLKVHKISKSQAWQRTGRAGRESSGTCYRLFTEAEFESMPLSTVPEILRSNLSSVGLQLIALGMKDLANFDFMNKPSAESLEAALNELEALGAIKKSENKSLYELTAIGKRMAQFPLEPKLSRCILAAEKLNCVEDVLKIVSVLSVDSIFHSSGTASMSNASKKDLAETIKQKFVSADGDHITLLNVYKAFVANKNNRVSVLSLVISFFLVSYYCALE